MINSGLNMGTIKDHNRALIIQLICTNSGVTRHFLSEASNLTSMTLTNITSDLIKSKLVCEVEPQNTKKGLGRVPKLLYLAPNSPVVAGICMSKDALYGIITDLSLQLLVSKKIFFDSNENKKTITEKLLKMAEYLIHFSSRPLLGLGVSTVGVVDAIHGKISYITDFFDFKELEIASSLQSALNIPVFVKNDMQSAALCEMYFGLGKQKDHFIYVGLTNGVGSAIVANKQLLNNLTGSSGELGHMSINYLTGEQCKCGSRGCLELYTSVPKIIGRINRKCQKNFSNFQEAITYCENSTAGYSVLKEVAEQLSYALNNLINIVDISTILFGHSGVYLPDSILDAIAEHINKISLFRYNRSIKLYKSSFDDKSPILGAACNVIDQVFNGNPLI